jgi:hypothetical protein
MTTRMSPTRKVALAGGVAYLVTFAASIPQLGLFADLAQGRRRRRGGPDRYRARDVAPVDVPRRARPHPRRQRPVPRPRHVPVALVPRLIPTIGLIGAPLILASATGTLFGAWDQVSVLGGIGALPIAVWEFSLGVYLTAKGFRESAPAPQPDARPHAYS